MGKRLAIVIAVETYSDTRIGAVKYAEADAKGFAEALELGGSLDKVFLLSTKATKTTITSQVGQHVKALTSDDQLYLFYAGHGFSKNAHNFITCHDTDLDDLEDTSINLKQLLDTCGKSKCKRIALFLDSCESGITDMPDIRGIYTTMSENELRDFFMAAEYRTCFASCKTQESSYSTSVLKHGIWTYHVIEALQGNAGSALEKGRYVTAHSLQNYLAAELPRTLLKLFSKPTVQTPWVYGSQNQDFIISDLQEVINQRAAAKPGYDQIKQVFFRTEESVKIASLSGFKKGHHVPAIKTGSTESFVQSISQKEVEGGVEEVFDLIRKHMKYKRKDLLAKEGRIVTPDFEFGVECSHNAEDPTSAILSRTLINISPTIVEDDGFNKVFESCFEDISFDFNKRVDLQHLIDQLEDLDLETVTIAYPFDCSYCDLVVKGSPLEIRVTADGMTVHAPCAVAPKQLVQSFFSVQKALAGSPVLKAIEHGRN